jgi:hypothetical protein
MRTRTTLGAVILLVAIAVRAAYAKAGYKPGDVYHSPLHNFDFTIPKFDGTKVQETHDEIHGHVTVVGGSGDMERIGYQHSDPPALLASIGADSILAFSRAALSALDSLCRATLVTSTSALDAPSRAALLETMDRWMPGVDLTAHGGGAVPDSAFVGLTALAFEGLVDFQDHMIARYQGRLVSREAVLRDSTLMILTILVAPSESGSTDLATGKPIDVVYAHLVFIKNGFWYSLVTRPNDFATGMALGHPGHPEDTLAPFARRLAEGLYARITFH